MDLFLAIFFPALILVINDIPELVVMSTFAAAGRWKSILIFWLSGIIAGSFMYYLALKGLTLVPEGLPIVFLFLKGAAAAMFVSIGFGNLRKDVDFALNQAEQTKEKIKGKDFLEISMTGALLIVSSPFNIGFALTAVPAITGKTEYSLMDIIYIRSGVIAADIVLISLYIIPLMYVRNFMTPKIMSIMRYISSFAMIGIGLFIVINMILQGDLKQAGLL